MAKALKNVVTNVSVGSRPKPEINRNTAKIGSTMKRNLKIPNNADIIKSPNYLTLLYYIQILKSSLF